MPALWLRCVIHERALIIEIVNLLELAPIGWRRSGTLEPVKACRYDCARGLLNLLRSSLLEDAVTFGRSRRATRAKCRLRHP